MTDADRALVDEIMARLDDRLDRFVTQLQGEIAMVQKDLEHGDRTLAQVDIAAKEAIRSLQMDQGRLAGRMETVEGDVNRALDTFRQDALAAVAKLGEDAAAGRARLHEKVDRILIGWHDEHGRTIPQRLSQVEQTLRDKHVGDQAVDAARARAEDTRTRLYRLLGACATVLSIVVTLNQFGTIGG